MWSNMFPAETERALADRAAHPRLLPAPEPGIWSKAGALVAAPYTGFAQAVNQTLRVAYRATQWRPDVEPLAKTVDPLANDPIDMALRSGSEYWAENPSTATWASSFLHEGSRILSKVAGYSLVGGVPGAIVGTSADEGATQYLTLRDRGVDQQTAARVAVVHGGATALSVALPVVGRTALQTAALVGVGGPGMFVSEQVLSRKILEQAKYADIATEFDPWDPAGLATSLVPGAVVGTAVHRSRAQRAKAAGDDAHSAALKTMAGTPEAVEAAHVQYGQDVIDAHLLAERGDIEARSDHRRAVNAVSKALDEGRPIELGDIRLDEAVAKRALDDVVERLRSAREAAPRTDAEPLPTRLADAGDDLGTRADIAAAHELASGHLSPTGPFDRAELQNLAVGIAEAQGDLHRLQQLSRVYDERVRTSNRPRVDIAADVVEELRGGGFKAAPEPPVDPATRALRIAEKHPGLRVRLEDDGTPARPATDVLQLEQQRNRIESGEAKVAFEAAIECFLRTGVE